MGGFRGGRGGPCPPFFLDFRVVLFNHPKDVHYMCVWSVVALSPNFFWPPLSECSRSAPDIGVGIVVDTEEGRVVWKLHGVVNLIITKMFNVF